MSMSAAILCPAVYISDAINKAGMCYLSTKIMHGEPDFFWSSLVKSEKHGHMVKS